MSLQEQGKGLIARLKQKGFVLKKSFRLGPKPVIVEHAVKREFHRAKTIRTLRKVQALLKMLLEKEENTGATGMRNVYEEVGRRLGELQNHRDI
jgi:hypothetical protein